MKLASLRRIGEGVADAHVLHAFDVRDDEADLAGTQRLGRRLMRGEVSQPHHFAVLAGAHQANLHRGAELAAEHAHQTDDALVNVVPAIENERARGAIGGNLGRRDALDDSFQYLVDADALFRAGQDRVFGAQPDGLLDLMARAIDIGARQIDFVDYRDDFEAVVDRHIDVGEGLCLDPLARIDHQQRALACGEAARHLVGKIDVTGSINKIQNVGFAVGRLIVEADRARLDGDAALALQIHRVEELFLELALGERAGAFEQAIGERRLAVIDMRNNREITNELR